MMYQKIIVPVDHGNRNMKTEHKIFTSGFVESDCRPALGEYLQYDGRYYALTEQRIPYMRDKTLDDRFFILTLFAVAMEAEKQMLNTKDTLPALSHIPGYAHSLPFLRSPHLTCPKTQPFLSIHHSCHVSPFPSVLFSYQQTSDFICYFPIFHL